VDGVAALDAHVLGEERAGEVAHAVETDAYGDMFTYSYDARGNLVGVAGPLGFRAEVTFDGRGRPVTVTDSYGSHTELVYTGGPHPVTIRQADGSTQRDLRPMGTVSIRALTAFGFNGEKSATGGAS
jgi:YD repeat-containing protein